MRKRECVREQLHDVTSYANLINRNTHHVLLRKQEDYQAHREGQKWELKPSIQLKTIVVKKKINHVYYMNMTINIFIQSTICSR